jgi:hypothetical protein
MAINTNVNLVVPTRNADGVLQYYGTAEALVDRGQYINTMDAEAQHCLVFNVDWADVALGTDATHNYVLSYNAYLPKGAYTTRAVFQTTVAWDSTSNNVALNFGLVAQDDYEIIDADGLMDTVAKTVIDLAGNEVITSAKGGYPDVTTYEGALHGVILAGNSLVTCFWENNAPTVGSGILKVYYRFGLVA